VRYEQTKTFDELMEVAEKKKGEWRKFYDQLCNPW
jgi:hypothetical protein